jgi:two-component system, cell cycle sensor histidine kinase and response regulator CckA
MAILDSEHSPRAGRRQPSQGAAPGSGAPPANSLARLSIPAAGDAAFHAVFDTSSEALVVVNSAGLVLHANPRARDLLCLTESAVRRVGLGEFVPDAAPAREPGRPAGIWTQLFAVSRAHSLEAALPTGAPVRFVLRSVLAASGDLLLCVEAGGVAGHRDVNWRQLEDQLLQTEKMAALGHLVSGIAHELNNPLTAIMGYAQLLLGHGLAPQPLSEAEKVYQQAERARRIVKNLLYFARENKTERTRVDVNEIVERTVALRSYELKVENIAVESDLDPQLPPTMADPYQLQQILLNLLVNAEHALLEDRGKGRVRIRTWHAPSPAARAESGRILLEVSDDGPGIPAAHVSQIFDPFFTTKPPGVGTGLGLSIVYGIVKQHGGEVTFENQPGSGAKFTVELPVVPVSPAPETAVPQGAERASRVAAGRILVVEDEPTVAQLIVDVLAEEGHHTEFALDSQDGLTRLARGQFDLVICDLRMPRLDGPAFYDALVRAGSPVRDRILFITGDTLARRTVEFLEPNDFPYLAKPFLVEELKLSVNRLLGAGKAPREDPAAAGKVPAGAEN